MKRNKIVLIAFTFVISLLFMSGVSAEKISCQYQEMVSGSQSSSKENMIIASYYTDKTNGYPITYNEKTIYYGNNYEYNDYPLPNGHYVFTEGSCENKNNQRCTTIQEYAIANGDCTPYFYVYIPYDELGSSQQYSYYGYFSNIGTYSINDDYVNTPHGGLVHKFVFVSSVKENSLACSLTASNNYTLDLQIDYTNKIIIFSNDNLFNMKLDDFDYNIDEIIKEAGLKKQNYITNFFRTHETAECPDDLMVCYNEGAASDSPSSQPYITSKDNNYETPDKPWIKCQEFEKSEKILVGIDGCHVFDDYQKEYLSLKSDNQFGKSHNVLQTLKSFCSNIVSQQHYSSDKKSCIYKCLHYDELLELEGEYTNNECGVSTRIINWIDNIFRWIKYILPVLVIVLSILDFIKAIAADKDDEIKKAQGRFVRRLIVAALAFLIPLIITFVLEKMGFTSDSCGLW